MAKTFKDFGAKLRAAMDKISEPSNMKKYGEIAADSIRIRTRLGYGVKGEGRPRQSLKPLASKTKDSRARLKAKSKLSPLTSPGKSNLTQSGEMLGSIEVVSAQKGRVTIAPTGTRDDGLSNRELATFVEEQGRPFHHLSDLEKKKIDQAIDRDLQSQLKRI